MANTYTQLMYHVMFSTKDRRPAIHEEYRDSIFRYIWGIHDKSKCHLYRIGGIEDHIHILTSIPTSQSIAKYVEGIKTGSTNWIRRESVVPRWPGWQDGYGAFTVSWKDKNDVIEYIKKQKEHHQKESFVDEYRRLLAEAGVEFDEKYLF